MPHETRFNVIHSARDGTNPPPISGLLFWRPIAKWDFDPHIGDSRTNISRPFAGMKWSRAIKE